MDTLGKLPIPARVKMANNTRVVSSRLTRPRPLPSLRSTGVQFNISKETREEEEDVEAIPQEPIPQIFRNDDVTDVSHTNYDALAPSQERLIQDLMPEESSMSLRDLPSMNTTTQAEEASVIPIGDKVESPSSDVDEVKVAALYEALRRRTNTVKDQAPNKGQDTLYFERMGYFARKHRSQIKRRSQDELGSIGIKYQDAGVAYLVQKQFHNFALIVQGYLSGLSLGKAVFAIYFANEEILQDAYQHISLPVHVAFVVAFSIACVAAYDRLGLYGLSWQGVVKTVSHSGFLGAVLWTVALISSLLCMRFDVQLSERREFTSTDVLFWRISCAVRAVAAGAAWLLLALKPEGDELADAIQRAVEKEIESEKNQRANNSSSFRQAGNNQQNTGDAGQVQGSHTQ